VRLFAFRPARKRHAVLLQIGRHCTVNCRFFTLAPGWRFAYGLPSTRMSLVLSLPAPSFARAARNNRARFLIAYLLREAIRISTSSRAPRSGALLKTYWTSCVELGVPRFPDPLPDAYYSTRAPPRAEPRGPA